MKRTQIQLTEEQAQKLDDIAQKDEVSKAEIIRRALDQWFLQEGHTDPDLAWEKSMKAVGCIEDDQESISSNHDEHLADAYGE